MDIAAVLVAFERDPGTWEAALRSEEKRDCSLLALNLCTISRPGAQNSTANGVTSSVRLLALAFLLQIIEKHWCLPSSFLRRTKQAISAIPRIRDEDKAQLMIYLLEDVTKEAPECGSCARKRAQCIAAIAKHNWMQWPSLFPILSNSPGDTYQHGLLAGALHAVLKELALSPRTGATADAFRRCAADLYPKLFHQLTLVFRRTVNFEAMANADAELAARICKSINSIIKGCDSVGDLPLGPYFEIVLAAFSLRPSSVSTLKLLRALRKTCLVTVRSHPLMFRDVFLTAFADRTASTLASSTGAEEDEDTIPLIIFCFAFWTELVSLRAFATSRSESVERSLALVARRALFCLRLTSNDVHDWQERGGEAICFEDDGESDAPLVSALKEDSIRRAARRFLQACFDQPLADRADVVLGEIFGTQYADSLAVEAAFLAVQLSASRLHGQWNFDEFLKLKLIPCFEVSSVVAAPGAAKSHVESAFLARRACLVIRAWLSDVGQDAAVLVLRTLGCNVIVYPGCDLGVALAAIECAHSILDETTIVAQGNGGQGREVLMEALRPLLDIDSLARLFARFQMVESRRKLLAFIETLVLIVRDPDWASAVVQNIVPLSLATRGEGLVETAAIDLAGTCVQSVGLSTLDAPAQAMCLDLILLASTASPARRAALDEAWPRLLLMSLRTSESIEAVAPLLVRPVLANLPDTKTKCLAAEFTCLLWRFSPAPVRSLLVPDLSWLIVDLAEMFLNSQRSESTVPKQGDSVLSREDPGDPFEVLYLCRCLDTIARTKLAKALLSPLPALSDGLQALERRRIAEASGASAPNEENWPLTEVESKRIDEVKVAWTKILNSCEAECAGDSQADSREVIERVSVSARVLLAGLARFASVGPAVAFAALCLKYIDAVGFAPSEAAWRRKLWAAALLTTLSMCRGATEVRQVFPLVVHACAGVVRAQQDVAEPPCFTAVDEDIIDRQLDRNHSRREMMFGEDPFLIDDVNAAFKKVWQMLFARIGNQLLQIMADAENAAPEIQALMGLNNGFDPEALPLLLLPTGSSREGNVVSTALTGTATEHSL